MIKFVVAAAPIKPSPELADPGDPVVPTFPAPPRDEFVSVRTLKPCHAAVVTEIDDDVFNAAAAAITAVAPGIPAEVAEAYVLNTAAACRGFELGTVVKTRVDYDSADIFADNIKKVEAWRSPPGSAATGGGYG